jgi:hypothetical protein
MRYEKYSCSARPFTKGKSGKVYLYHCNTCQRYMTKEPRQRSACKTIYKLDKGGPVMILYVPPPKNDVKQRRPKRRNDRNRKRVRPVMMQ